jgi:starch phosphorylase
MDLRWSWNHSMDELWRQLDPALWALTNHPSVVLQTVTRERLASALADPDFCQLLERMLEAKRQAETTPRWFQERYPQGPLNCVAYFCMEFMLSEALPIYSGGLGNVAGDQLKAASDLGVPVIGVGLLYQHGYFRQVIDRDGAQQALYPYNDPGQLPITPVLQPNGEWLRLEIALPGYSVWVRTWQVQVGRIKLYLLDTNDAANIPVHRGITSELYGGGQELRLKQEIVLGMGGWRLLAALGIKPDVCHLNEGHAAFALLERAHSFMQKDRTFFRRGLGGHAARKSLHHPHRGRRGVRPFSSGIGRAVSRPVRAGGSGAFAARVPGARSPESRRRCRTLQHGLPGHARERGGQWRQPIARPSQPANLRAALFHIGRWMKCRWVT